MTDFGRRPGQNYVDRGDPNDWDLSKTDFVTDNTWRDLDLSSLVPDGAAVIHFKVIIKAPSADKHIQFRQKGNANNFNIRKLLTLVADLEHNGYFFVPCDTNQYIQYRASNITWARINVLVMGWLI